jgi:hypothetical protein
MHGFTYHVDLGCFFRHARSTPMSFLHADASKEPTGLPHPKHGVGSGVVDHTPTHLAHTQCPHAQGATTAWWCSQSKQHASPAQHCMAAGGGEAAPGTPRDKPTPAPPAPPAPPVQPTPLFSPCFG